MQDCELFLWSKTYSASEDADDVVRVALSVYHPDAGHHGQFPEALRAGCPAAAVGREDTESLWICNDTGKTT